MIPSNVFKHPFDPLTLFTNKPEILSCESVKPCKNRAVMSQQQINPVQILHPSNSTFKFPLLGYDAQSNARAIPGEDVELSN